MFETLEMAPPDPILGLNEAFKKDPNPNKINLGVGVFQDESGKTPTLACVRRAEAALLELDAPKTYLPIQGAPEYGQAVRALLFGKDQPYLAEGRAVTLQSPGGTGALRLSGELMRTRLGLRKIWVSDPTWANHRAIFEAAGLEVLVYPYYDAARRGLDFARMCAQLEKLGPDDAVLLHTCCHNPSGVDPSAAEWARICELAQERGFFPVFDFAYQGFGDGIDEDAWPLRTFAEAGLELVVCSSFSKNFGLYNERVGAISLLAKSADAAERGLSQLKSLARANYSNPPSHGGSVVRVVLTSSELSALWRDEVTQMRERIATMRKLFVETLAKKGVERDFSFIVRQKGMFSFAGITPAQVDALRDRHSIYAVRSGRINVAGLSVGTMDRLCEALADVLR